MKSALCFSLPALTEANQKLAEEAPHRQLPIADIRQAIIRRLGDLAGNGFVQGLQAVLSDYPLPRRAWETILWPCRRWMGRG